MEEIKKNKNRKLRLSVIDDETLEEVNSIKLSKPLLFSIIGTAVLLIFAIVFLFLVYTPLNLFIPSRVSLRIKNNVIKNSLLIDSLEAKTKTEKIYLENIKTILQGKPINDTFDLKRVYNDTSIVISENGINKIDLDSIIRAELEDNEVGIVNETAETDKEDLKNLHFIMPLKGLISDEFDAQKSHFGIDIVPGENETVLSTLSGTVILATWSVETGYVIGVQHNLNLISFYKHNSVLLKKQGDKVKSGESIAMVGNSGEQTTGTHLHFEIWDNGTPINPRDYISF